VGDAILSSFETFETRQVTSFIFCAVYCALLEVGVGGIRVGVGMIRVGVSKACPFGEGVGSSSVGVGVGVSGIFVIVTIGDIMSDPASASTFETLAPKTLCPFRKL
jgi:hypothetical protein